MSRSRHSVLVAIVLFVALRSEADRPLLAIEAALQGAQPLSLAAADFDEDGVPDLLSGHRTPQGGIVLLHRGNVDALFPHHPGASRRREAGQFTEHPFFPAAPPVALPEAPEFLGAGDFDADGHADVIAAARGGRALVWRKGDGRGGFAAPATIALPAPVLAMARGRWNDLAVVAGDQLLLLRREDGGALREGRRERIDAPIASLAFVDFGGTEQLVIVQEDGATRILEQGAAGTTPFDAVLPAGAAQAFGARLAGFSGERLAGVDAARRRIHLPGEVLEFDGEIAAVLPMRLNADALTDLVILKTDASGEHAVVVAPSAARQTFTVANANDGGTGSLRQAILDANANPGADAIQFNLPGAGPHRIVIQSALPDIRDAVTIDGATQPGFAGAPLIEIAAANIGYTNGLRLNGSNSTIRGLILNTLLLGGTGTAGNQVEGNYLGVNAAGTGPLSESSFFEVNGSASILIGGTRPEARNLIFSGARINGATGAQIQGNYIGVNAAGTGAIENSFNRRLDGLYVTNCKNVLIGGALPGAGNIIAGNLGSGLSISASEDTRVEGNLIGTQRDAASPLGNARHGILVIDSARNTSIGGTGAGQGNAIAFNAGSGVFLDGGSVRNGVRGNAIFENGGLGVDWRVEGVEPNFINEGAWEPERKQNFPELLLATTAGGGLTVKGTLNSHANSSFAIDFYASPAGDPTGYGEGRTYLGSTTITTDATFNGRFAATLPVAVAPGQIVTALAIRQGGTTSEFSHGLPVVAGCSSLSPAAAWSYDYSGGVGNVSVGATNNCAWTAVVSAPWITVVSRGSGVGDGILDFVVAPNPAPAVRTGVIEVNGQTVNIRQDGRVTAVHGASYAAGKLPFDGILAAFGAGLATRTEAATTLPLPTSLAGTTVKLTDPVGNERLAPLFFVSPNQINFLVQTVYAGPSKITITSGDGVVSSGPAQIEYSVPGLFSANATGSGVLSGYVLRIRADGQQVIEPVSRWDPAAMRNVAAPIDLGPETEAVFLIAFGTGIRFAQRPVQAFLGSEEAQVLFAGSQGVLAGLDQVNIRLPRSLIGAGEIPLRLVFRDAVSNTLQVQIK